jgi:hypothetical protein
MKLAKEVAGTGSAQLHPTLNSQMDKVTQKPTARNVGQLAETVQTANNEAIQADVAQSLRSKGIPWEKANILAKAFTARLTGQKLNP